MVDVRSQVGMADWAVIVMILATTAAIGFTVAVFAFQVVLSRWWLSKHRYGPMEWLWRWLTYGRRPAMRLAPLAG